MNCDHLTYHCHGYGGVDHMDVFLQALENGPRKIHLECGEGGLFYELMHPWLVIDFSLYPCVMLSLRSFCPMTLL